MGLISDLYNGGVLPLIAAPIILVCAASLSGPKMNGQRPVIRLEESMSYAFDFDKDGKLDAAFYTPVGGTPRVPSYRIPIRRDTTRFRELQTAYDNIRI